MLLRQPAGQLLDALLENGADGEGMCEPVDGGGTLKALVALRQWGFVRTSSVVHCPTKMRYRVTALGRAAHAWGWAALHLSAAHTRVCARGAA
jgi:hypothetical protein